MRTKKSLTWVALAITLLLVLTGCSPNQQEVFKAAMKMQNVNSMQSQTEMSFQLNGTGFEPDVQQQIDQAALFLNNAKLDLDVKMKANEQKTVAKSQMAINLVTQGMTINMPLWVDSDLTGNTPKVTEIIKLPQMATAALPTQFTSKEYMVLNPTDMHNPALENIDMTKLINFSKNFQETGINFLNNYSQRFNPSIDVTNNGIQYVQTSDGLKSAQMYELKLNDAQFKAFIRYTVNNFVQDEEAMNFVKQFMASVLEFSQVPDKAEGLSNFNQSFDKIIADKPHFLAKFNTVMDQLDDVTLLGDKGITLQYAISNGYLIQKSGAIDFKFNMAQMAQLMDTSSGKQTASANNNGTLNMLVNFSTIISGINNQPDIQIPEVNTTNSFNYLELMNLLTEKT